MDAWEIVEPNRQSTSRWAGGETTELYIYPRGEQYAQRQFAFRISTATVELERSEFTALPGYTRHLMLLRGNLRLVHQSRLAKALRPFQVDTFQGGWHTVSYGRCTDLGLMLARGWAGGLRPLTLQEAIYCKQAGFIGLYALGHALVDLRAPGFAAESVPLAAGSFLALWHSGGGEAAVTARPASGCAEPCHVVAVFCRQTGEGPLEL